MPDKVTQKYHFGGWQEVLIYSEQEMADALGISRNELRRAIADGLLSYHAHPKSNALREYQFNQISYDNNLRKWSQKN